MTGGMHYLNFLPPFPLVFISCCVYLKSVLKALADKITKYTSNTQKLGSAGEDDALLAIWVMKDLGAHRKKGFVLQG